MIVDVFKYNNQEVSKYSEFYGIDITTGYYEHLNSLLLNGNYKTILIHSLTEELWGSIKIS